MQAVTESDLEKLQRWELHGAAWRVRSLDSGRAAVELLTCHGEAVDELRSSDPELLRYLAGRRSSEHPSP
jgi:hypothetical protein